MPSPVLGARDTVGNKTDGHGSHEVYVVGGGRDK